MKINEMTKTWMKEAGCTKRDIKITEDFVSDLEKDDFILLEKFIWILGRDPNDMADFRYALKIFEILREMGYVRMGWYEKCPSCGAIGWDIVFDTESMRGKLFCRECGAEIDVDDDLYLVYCVE